MTTPETKKLISPTSIVALQPFISAKNAAPKVGISPRTIETYFSELKKEDIIKCIGSDRSGKWNIKL